MTDVLGPKQRQWVNALLSGDYAQGRCRLHYSMRLNDRFNDRYCCLGVAEAIFKLPELDNKYLTHTFTELKLNAPDGWFTSPIQCYGRVFKSLALMNDAGLSFYDIALIIQNYWFLIFKEKV